MLIRLHLWLPHVTHVRDRLTLKRQSWALLLVFCLLAFLPSRLHADTLLPQISSKLSLAASLRVRGEFWDWFEGSSGDHSYAYAATVAKFGLKWSDELFDLYVEGQNSSLMGLPDDASAPAPQAAFGLGTVYRAHNRRNDDSGIFLKQAHLTLKESRHPRPDH